MMSRSRSQGTEVTIVTGAFLSYSEVTAVTQIQTVSRSEVDQHREMNSTVLNVSGDQDN